MDYDSFRSTFGDRLREAGNVLEESGYQTGDDRRYRIFLETADGFTGLNFGGNPEKLLDQTLDDLRSEEAVTLEFDAEKLVDGITGYTGPENRLYQAVRGQVVIREPLTDEDFDGGFPAKATDITYVPDFPEDYFTVEAPEVLPPYTEEAAEQQINELAELLEASGIRAQAGRIATFQPNTQ